MLSLSSTTEKNYSLVERKKKMRGEDWASFFLCTTSCCLQHDAIQYDLQLCISVKNVFTECPCDADGNTIRREPDSASLFESNNQTLPTLQQTERQRIMQNTGELTMTKAPVRLRNLHLDHSASSPLGCCRQEVFHGNCY